MPTVEDILMEKGPDIIIALPTLTVLEAAKMMCEANTGSIVVKDDEVRGIFTERDLLRRVVATGKDPAKTLVTDVMSPKVRSVTLETDVRQCQKILRSEHIRHLAVIEEGVLVGMIGLRDVLQMELDEDEKLLHELQADE